MSLNNDFDVGPLTWVKNEIDTALNKARDRLAEVQADPSQREPLRYAQNFVHQASGALSVVGLDGVLQFAEAIDKLLSALATNELAVSPDLLALALRAIGMLGNYINEVAAGAPHQPLRLFSAYQELIVARGGEAPQPSELFFPDLGIRPALEVQEAVAPERAAHELRVLRGRFEKGLLNWLRKPQETTGAQEMLGAVRRIEQIQALPATRAFWWAAIAFFEGLATQAIPVDRNAQRMCRRIDTQMRRLLEGSQVIAERLVRDVLYFVATAHIESQHADTVRATYGLDRILPSANVELSDTLRQPHMLRVRETLEHAKDAWNRFCAGAAVALPQFQEQVSELTERIRPLRLVQVMRLLSSLETTLAWLREDPMRLSDDLSMEIATSLLVIEQANDAPNADPDQLQRQVDLLVTRLHARCQGEFLPEFDLSLFGDVSQRAQERLFFNQLAREILTNLGQIEQTLDAFFRNATQREALTSLAGPLKQIEGAFEVLGEPRAVQLVKENAAAIVAMAASDEAPDQEAMGEIAHQLSALGFYVDALKTGPVRLEDFLNPASKLDEELVVAAGTTVEAQLQRQARETHGLVEALKDAPSDEGIRQQLVTSLEAIREDAQLVANSDLEQTAKEALQSLKSGGDAMQGGLSEALANVAPSTAAPHHSQEAERLLLASNEEIDAELLEIFLEEAEEVLQSIAMHRNNVVAEPHDLESMTTVRRGFHTLKGSSRMVGLTEFSDVAREVEITLNRWLQLEKDSSPELVELLDSGCLTFGAWVEQLNVGGGLSYDAHDLIERARALLGSLDSPADELPASPAAKPAPAVITSPAYSEPKSSVKRPPTEVDLTSTLMDLDLAELILGEQDQTEVDLAVTDFEGDALRAFTEEFGSQAAEVASDQQAERFASPVQDLGGEELDLELELDDLDHSPSQSLGEVVDTSALTTEAAPDGDLLFELDELEDASAPAGTGPTLTEIGNEVDAPLVFEPLPELPGIAVPEDVLTVPAEAAPQPESIAFDVAPPVPSALDVGDENVEIELEPLQGTELDLTSTDLSGLSQFFDAQPEQAAEEAMLNDLDVDLGILDEEAPTLALADPVPEALSLQDSGPETESFAIAAPVAVAEFVEQSAPLVPAEGLPGSESERFTVMRAEESGDVEEIAIDDFDDEFDTSIMDLSALGQKPVEDMPAFVAGLNAPDAADEVPTDSEILIGNKVLSQGLYDLYIAESRQLLDKLLDEHQRLAANPLRLPTIDAIRAAHTLAGISGTARIEPAYSLGKALEHALHRFADVDVAPDAAQTNLIGTAVVTLDGMLADVLQHAMPADVPELLEQITALQPESREAASEGPGESAAAQTYPDSEVPALLPLSVVQAPAEDVEVIAAASQMPEPPMPLEAGSGPLDELDDQLLPIFFEEVDELMVDLGGSLRDMRSESGGEEGRKSLARLLHTLKGSARMAGAMRLGQYVHNLETFLEASEEAGHRGLSLVDDLENGLDHVGLLIAALKNPPAASVEAETEPEFEAIEPVADIPFEDVAAPESFDVKPTVQAVRDAPVRPVFEEPEQSPTQQRAPIRVKAELVDRFVNEAGEVSIARTRIEGEFRILRRSLLDLTENVIRLRNQLRELEIQAESQMQTRLAAAESQHGDFDPLEFDRFTRLQELTRMMAESVGDVTTIQQNLLRNLDSADAALHAQGRLSRDLQQALMSVRMVPFEELADRLYRVVRQTSKELGKRANLDIIGGAIEIDRGVLDKMTAPIEHLLRNAIAHGIEMPAERVAAGKPEVGQVNLKLTQLSNEIALELSDDGRGLDYDRILARGRASGLVSEGEIPNENRLTQLIFEPGFSTAEKVSGISGRGIGMDVVKNETMAVGGRITVMSNAGQGSRFVVHLPLTLAVTQALLVRCGERTYAIPSNMVEQALELKEAALVEVQSKGYVDWKESQYPLVYLPRLLGDMHAQPGVGRYHWVLLVRGGSQTLAVHIDELRGNQEIVVKNAGPQFVRLQGYSGATVLADGEISLILNPVALAARHSAVVSIAAAREANEEMDDGYIEPPVTRIPSVMVVDDSLTVRKITTRLLEREGFQVVTAKDGVDALERLIDYKPDVMLLDIEMPRMDGFDLARNVRADPRLVNVPIIMITSRMADKHRNYAFEIGVNHYLGKPYQEEQLLELITGFIAAQRP